MIILSKSTIKFVYFSDFLQMFSFLILLDIIKKEKLNSKGHNGNNFRILKISFSVSDHYSVVHILLSKLNLGST